MNNVHDSDRATRKLEAGCLELRDGRFDRGWIAYELRHRLHPIPASLFQPQWQGEPLDGKHIKLHREQGIGDEIWFASAVPDVVGSAGRCTITCDPRLVALYARSSPHGFQSISATLLRELMQIPGMCQESWNCSTAGLCWSGSLVVR